jgi:hypothetical protein
VFVLYKMAILTDFGIGCLVIIIYIGHYFLPIAYVIFILTQRLVPVIELGVIQCFSYILVSLLFLCHLTARSLFNLLEPWDVRALLQFVYNFPFIGPLCSVWVFIRKLKIKWRNDRV